MKLLNQIQQTLKAPKGQINKFGNYKYRSCEDILEAVKPLLGAAVLLITDDIHFVSDRVYVKATATITDEYGTSVSVSAFAREPLDKKGMDASQITGAASSYARKYALNGLFLIDDTKDADATNDHSNGQSKLNKPLLQPATEAFEKAMEYIEGGGNIEKIKSKYVLSPEIEKQLKSCLAG